MGDAVRSRRRLVVALVVLSGAGGCEGLPTACTDELRVSLGPQDTVLTVGASIAPRVRLSSCGGREELPERVALTSSDPAVVDVSVNPLRLNALSEGLAYVQVVDSTYGSLGTLRLGVAATP